MTDINTQEKKEAGGAGGAGRFSLSREENATQESMDELPPCWTGAPRKRKKSRGVEPRRI